MEVYVGPKFRTVTAASEPPREPVAAELLEWCRRWSTQGYIAKAMGNLSARASTGFLITPTGTAPDQLTVADIVHVLAAEMAPPTVTVAGKHEPSSETLMHAAIYAARPAVGAVFHGHNDQLLAAAARLGLPVTAREHPYGTPAMATGVVEVLADAPVIIMRNHGFVAVGATMADANGALEQIVARL